MVIDGHERVVPGKLEVGLSMHSLKGAGCRREHPVSEWPEKDLWNGMVGPPGH